MENDLIIKYKDAAKAHGEGTRKGHAKFTNHAYDTLVILLRKISESDADKELLGLFNDDNIWVQIWAAAHSLEINEQEARAKLQTIADASIPITSTSARYILQGWDEGTLKFRT